MSEAAGQPWMGGDVYFGDTEKAPPDWRAGATAHDRDDDAPPSPAERKAVAGVLGFDPAEPDEDKSVDALPALLKRLRSRLPPPAPGG